ncbi:MAG: sensor histidine kinase [Flavobacteriales bacterium]|nr:sensor histidine kinase [Flavobacteriales bacterium]
MVETDVETAAERLFRNASLEWVYFEAISNALDWGAKSVTISIRLNALNEHKTLAIDIVDDGLGMETEGFLRFAQLWNVKDKAHKGQGRFVYLNNFSSARVRSVSENEIRDFYFDKNFKKDGVIPTNNDDGAPTGTSIFLTGYKKERIWSSDYVNPTALKKSIIKTFYPRLYDKKKKGEPFIVRIELDMTKADPDIESAIAHIDVQDLPTMEELPLENPSSLFTDLNLFYYVQKDLTKRSIITALNVDGRSFLLDVIPPTNWPVGIDGVFILYSKVFEGQVDDTRQYLQMEDEHKKEIVGILSPVIDRLIKATDPTIQEKNEVTLNDLKEKFPHLDGLFPKDEIGVMDRKEVLKRAREAFFVQEQPILEAEHLDEAQYQKALEFCSRHLMEYILYRNRTITKLKEMKDDPEIDIHKAIVPRHKTHDSLSMDTMYINNAWVMDDKFMSYAKILSDQQLTALLDQIAPDRVAGDDEGGKPDMSIIFSGDFNGSKKVDLVVVELKKKEVDLKEQEWVVSQLLQRARRIVTHYEGKIQRLWFYGITNLSEEFRLRLRDEDWTPLFSSGESWYKEFKVSSLNNRDLPSVKVGLYIIPFDTLLGDAEHRNGAFMRLLKESIKTA